MKEWLLQNGWTEFMDFSRHPDLDFYFAAKYKRFVLFGVPLLVRNQLPTETVQRLIDFAHAAMGKRQDYPDDYPMNRSRTPENEDAVIYAKDRRELQKLGSPSWQSENK